MLKRLLIRWYGAIVTILTILRASQTVHATHRNQQPDGYYSGRALAGAIVRFVAVPAERALVRPWDRFFWVSESKVTSFLRHEEADGYEQAEENAGHRGARR